MVVRLMGQGLPDFLGEEGHEGMQELERLREHIAQYPLGLILGGGEMCIRDRCRWFY